MQETGGCRHRGNVVGRDPREGQVVGQRQEGSMGLVGFAKRDREDAEA